MELYLTSVFKVLYETQPGVQQQLQVPPEVLAAKTAQAAFEQADLNADGKLSLAEFTRWYEDSGMGSATASAVQATVAQAQDQPASMTLEEVKRITTLGSKSVSQVLEQFAVYADGEGALSRDAFYTAFNDIMGPLSPELVDSASVIVPQLFDLFDADNSGKVDFSELASGLTVLCGGTRESKVEAAFALFDFDSNGYIEFSEMVLYLTSVFKVLFATNPGAAQQLGANPEEVARATAQAAFASADVDHDGRLSMEEFTRWYLANGDGSAAVEVAEASAASLAGITLEQLKRWTGLDQFTVDQVWPVFANVSSDGVITRAAFYAAFRAILEAQGAIEEPAITGAVLQRLFELFDTDGSGEIDFSECASALSTLCAGTDTSKVDAVFSLLDYDSKYVSRATVAFFWEGACDVIAELTFVFCAVVVANDVWWHHLWLFAAATSR